MGGGARTYKMRRRRRASSKVMEIVMLTCLVGGSCLQPPQVVLLQQLPQPVRNGSGRACTTSGCSGGRLERSRLSLTTACATPHRVATTTFQGFVQGCRSSGSSSRSSCRKASSTTGNNGRGEDSHRGATNGADQDVWVGERSGAPAGGGGGETMVGSPEFVDLVRAQFDVLVSVLGVKRVVLFARRENTETGELAVTGMLFCG